MSTRHGPKLTRRQTIPLMALAVSGEDSAAGARWPERKRRTAPEIPQVTVKFGHEPYFDHTQAIIGIEQGWFEDVGITLAPDNQGIVVGGDEALAVVCLGPG